MAKRIAMFNHKGGVGKTTTTFNLGWQLASIGKRVILVDADPQSNLTELALGYKGASELVRLYEDETSRNFKSGLDPAFESRPVLIEAVDCFPVENRDGLFLLPGHIGLSEYEVTLGMAQDRPGSMHALQNLPGSISRLLDKTAEKFDADYMLIDTNPSLSSFNQNLLVTSDYFLVPTALDYYSAMAIDSLAKVIPSWGKWARRAQASLILRNATYPFPQVSAKFIGTVIQNYRPRSGEPTRGIRQWISDIERGTVSALFPALERCGMALPAERYRRMGMDSYCLAKIPYFNFLIAKSQEHRTPIYDLTDQQINQTGGVLATTQRSQAMFRKTFSDLADKVIELTSDARSD